MKHTVLLALALAIALACGRPAQTDTTPAPEPKAVSIPVGAIGEPYICATSGRVETVTAETRAYEYDGKTYYMCASCAERFVADPKAFVAALQVKDRSVAQAEVGTAFTCPVSGEKGKVSETTTSVELAGRAYYFCCVGCVGRFRENPLAYLKPDVGAHDCSRCLHSGAH